MKKLFIPNFAPVVKRYLNGKLQIWENPSLMFYIEKDTYSDAFIQAKRFLLRFGNKIFCYVLEFQPIKNN